MSDSAGPSVAEIADQAAYAEAVQLATTASAAYYGAGDSALDDDDFDRLVRGITAYERAHPEQTLPDSPTGKVAGGAVIGDVPHTVPMLSLDNVFSADDLISWAAGLERRLGRPVAAWSVEPKLDGLAISARYRDGTLVQIITRGDGTAGEDVSHAIGTIAGLPTELSSPVTVEVRGEVLMTTDQFEAANTLRVEHGGTPFANPRSASAGSLRAKDRAYQVEMTFFSYGALPRANDAEAGRSRQAPAVERTATPSSDTGSPDTGNSDTGNSDTDSTGTGSTGTGSTDTGDFSAGLVGLPHSRILELVAGLGVQTTAGTPVGLAVCTTLDEIQTRVDEIAKLRAALPFGIDGIVIKADAATDQEEAGFSSRAPRWAIAYKLPATEKITKLLDVTWNVGRTGVIAPRAVLEPVTIDGSTITYATLHNPADITRRGLMIGDQVMVHRAGDVIPRVEAPVVHLRTGDERQIEFPECCPRCGADIDATQQRWRCVRGRACHAVASVSYAAGRDQLDIEGLGETRIVAMVEGGLLADFADLFTLTREQILDLDRMGELSTDNLLTGIETAKGKPLNKVFCALGIRGTGRSMSRRIARHFATMDAIRAADAEAFQAVEGVGPERATLLVEELDDLSPVIDKLVAAGVNMIEPGASGPGTRAAGDGVGDEVGGGAEGGSRDGTGDGTVDGAEADGGTDDLPLTGMTVVVTGSMTGPLEALSRNEMNELIERAGGKSSSSVSKKTSLLVAGENAGSKRAKAETLGVKLIAPEEFALMVEDHLV